MKIITKNFCNTLRTNTGFTIFELCIVIALVGIAAAVAIPRFTGMLDRGRLRSVTQQIASDLASTRTKAITYNCKAKITFSNYSYDIHLDEDGDGSYAVLEKSEDITEYNGVEIYQSVNPVFHSSGKVTTTGDIKIRNSYGERNVNINIIGRVLVD